MMSTMENCSKKLCPFNRTRGKCCLYIELERKIMSLINYLCEKLCLLNRTQRENQCLRYRTKLKRQTRYSTYYKTPTSLKILKPCVSIAFILRLTAKNK